MLSRAISQMAVLLWNNHHRKQLQLIDFIAMKVSLFSQLLSLAFIGWYQYFIKYDWIVTGITIVAALCVMFTAFLFSPTVHRYAMYADLAVILTLCLIGTYVHMTRTWFLDPIAKAYVEDHLGENLRPDAEFNNVQLKFVCCGERGPIDYNTSRNIIPASCCGKTKGDCDIYDANSKGCYKILLKDFKDQETHRALFTFLGRASGFVLVFFLHRRKYNELANAEVLVK